MFQRENHGPGRRPGWLSCLFLFGVALTLAPRMAMPLHGQSVVSQEPRDRKINVEKRVMVVGDDVRVLEVTGGEAGESLHWTYDTEVSTANGEQPRVRVSLTTLGLGSGYLGVELLPLTDALRRHFGVAEGAGVLVADLVVDGPAHRAGLEVGDVVTAIDGRAVAAPRDLVHSVRAKEKDDRVDLELFRSGHPLSLPVTVGERKRPLVKVEPDGAHFELRQLGPAGDEGVVVFVDEAVGQLREYFQGNEWKARLERLEKSDWDSIEARMEEVHRQLRSLEKKIEAADPDR